MYMIDYRTGNLEVLQGFKRRKFLLNLSMDTWIFLGRIPDLLKDLCRRCLNIETAGVYSVDARYI